MTLGCLRFFQVQTHCPLMLPEHYTQSFASFWTVLLYCFTLKQETIHMWINVPPNHQPTVFSRLQQFFILIILCLISRGIIFYCSCEKQQNWCFPFCFEWIRWYFSENTYKSREIFFFPDENPVFSNLYQKWILFSVLFLEAHEFGKQLELGKWLWKILHFGLDLASPSGAIGICKIKCFPC